jgi:CheY-like chemotaxis protein
VIVDAVMPDTDGMAFVRALRADPAVRDTTVILMGYAGDLGQADDRAALGVATCLYKPIKAARVRDVLLSTFGVVQAPASEAPARRNVTLGPKRRILVAEDNPVNQKVALLQLQRLGYRADAVGNGLEAVAVLAQVPYDLVLMDCQMPEMDGFEATRLIRASAPAGHRMPIIALTANAFDGDRERCLEAGMDDYLSKPVSIDDLAAAIRRWTADLEASAQARTA